VAEKWKLLRKFGIRRRKGHKTELKISLPEFYVTRPTRCRLLVWMYERNIIKMHVQVFLRMNTWMFETRRRHYK
jgi:hypothetical protein